MKAPKEVIDEVGYNRIWGVRAGVLQSYLEAHGGGNISWRNRGTDEEAKNFLLREISHNRPFVAPTSVGPNHYVVVVGVEGTSSKNFSVILAHWGTYEKVPWEEFRNLWRDHSIYSYAALYTDKRATFALKQLEETNRHADERH